MASTPPVKTRRLTRDVLASFLPTHELVKTFENMIQDVSVVLPEAALDDRVAIESAQTTANSAVASAAAAQADIDAHEAQTGIAVHGLGTAAVLSSDADASLAANSDARIATQKAVKTYADGVVAAAGAVIGPASSVNNNVVMFDGVTGKLIKDSGLAFTFSALPGKPTTATGYGIASIDAVPIGAATPSTGAFTTLSAAGLADLSGAAAGQIKFPATQNASANVNTLDDYEEGTWTPTISAGSGTFTSVAASNAVYTKVGRVVTYQLLITITTNGTAGGYVAFTLPFAATGTAMGTGRENALTGSGLHSIISGSTVPTYTYNNGYPGGNGAVLILSGTYITAT